MMVTPQVKTNKLLVVVFLGLRPVW